MSRRRKEPLRRCDTTPKGPTPVRTFGRTPGFFALPRRRRRQDPRGPGDGLLCDDAGTRPCRRGTWSFILRRADAHRDAAVPAGNVGRDGGGLFRRDAVGLPAPASPHHHFPAGTPGKGSRSGPAAIPPFRRDAGKKTKADGRRRRHPDGRKRTGEKKKGRGKKEGKGGTTGVAMAGERLTRGPQSKLSSQEAERPDLSETAKKRPGYPRGEAPCGSKVFAQGPRRGDGSGEIFRQAKTTKASPPARAGEKTAGVCEGDADKDSFGAVRGKALSGSIRCFFPSGAGRGKAPDAGLSARLGTFVPNLSGNRSRAGRRNTHPPPCSLRNAVNRPFVFFQQKIPAAPASLFSLEGSVFLCADGKPRSRPRTKEAEAARLPFCADLRNSLN